MTLGAARVIYTINDLSMFVDELVRGYVIMIGRAERGPMNDPQILSSWEEFERVFGKLVPHTTDPLVAKMGLLQGARLIYIRTAHYDDVSDPSTLTAKMAAVTLKDRADVPTPGRAISESGPFTFLQAHPGRTTGTEIGPYTVGAGVNDALKLRVGTPGVWGADQDVTLTEGTRTAQQVCDDVNTQTTGMNATVEDGKVRIEAVDVGHDIEIVAVANDVYSTLGLGEGVYSHSEGTDKLVVSIDGGTDRSFTLTPESGETGTFTLTAAQVAGQMSGLTGATARADQGKVRITSDTTGASSSAQVKSDSTADDPMGFDSDVHSGSNGAPADTLTFTAKDPGAFGDDLKVHIHEADLDPETSFDVRISYSRQGELNEYFAHLNMDPDDPRYVVNYINERSRLVRVADEGSVNDAPLNRPAVNDIGTPLTGGYDGLEGLNDADWIGDEGAHTGLYAVDKVAEQMAMDIVIPGTASVTVVQALTSYCEQRGFIGYMMVPPGLEPQDAVDWRMGNLPYTHEAFNSHRLTLWFGRPLVYDGRDDTRKYISNLGHLAACLCRTDNDYDYSFAPVGPRRGVTDYVEGVDFNIGDFPGYADLFAEFGINYLQISRLRGIEGAVFWEQRTTQRAASALRDLNVVRFLTAMRRMLVPVLRMFLFEPNHPVTWREVKRVLEPQFRLWKAKMNIYDYVLQCDEQAFFDGGELKNAVLNSGLEIDKGIYRARALIQPTKAIYYFEFEVGVTRTGEAFEKFTRLKELPGWVRR
jgi:hypothetical protein